MGVWRFCSAVVMACAVMVTPMAPTQLPTFDPVPVAAPHSLDARAQGVDDLNQLNEQVARLYAEGRYGQATELAERALALAERLHGPDSIEINNAVTELARLYRLQSRFPEAEVLYSRSVQIAEKAFDPRHPGIGIALNNLALLYLDWHRAARAEPLLLRALTIYSSIVGDEYTTLGVHCALGDRNLTR
jgi:tetratricopeptide (TPR) repeat protein